MWGKIMAPQKEVADKSVSLADCVRQVALADPQGPEHAVQPLVVRIAQHRLDHVRSPRDPFLCQPSAFPPLPESFRPSP